MFNQKYLLEICLGATDLKSNEDLSVSVVVPFYNRSRFLKRLLDSIAIQTLPAEKVYIIDNGSSLNETLSAWQIIMSHELYDKCLFTSSLGKGNANFARNLGYDLTETKYVAFLDSDDWWEKDHLLYSINILSNCEKNAIYGGAIIHYRNNIIKNDSIDIRSFDNPFSLIMSRYDYIAQTSSYIVDKSKLSYSVKWDESLKRHQDYDYFVQIFYNTSGWCFNPNPQVNIDWDQGGHKKMVNFESLIKFYEKWEDNIPKDIKKYYLLSMLTQTYFYHSDSNLRDYYNNKIIKESYFNSNLYKLRTCKLYIFFHINSVKMLNKIGLKHTVKNFLQIFK